MKKLCLFCSAGCIPRG